MGKKARSRGGPTDFAPQPLEDAVAWQVQCGEDGDKARTEYQAQIAAKKAGAKCEVCGVLAIWASARTGMCFPCTTGESDASNDYEFEEVCF